MKKTATLIFILISINTLISQGVDLPLSLFYLSDSIFNINTLTSEKISRIRIIAKHVDLTDINYSNDSSISLVLLNDAYFIDTLVFNQNGLLKTCKYSYENGLSKIECTEYYDEFNKNYQSCFRMKTVSHFKNGILRSYEEIMVDSQNKESKIVSIDYTFDKYVHKEIIKYNSNSSTLKDTTTVLVSFDTLGRIRNKIIDPVYHYNNSTCQYEKLPYSVTRYYEYLNDSIIETEYKNYHFYSSADSIKTLEQIILNKIYNDNLKITTKTINNTSINSLIFRDSINNLLFEYKYGEIKKTKYFRNTVLPETIYIFYDDSIDFYKFEYK